MIVAFKIRATKSACQERFAEPRDRKANRHRRDPNGPTETVRTPFEPRKSPQIAGYLPETGKRQFVSEYVVGPGGLEPPTRPL